MLKITKKRFTDLETITNKKLITLFLEYYMTNKKAQDAQTELLEDISLPTTMTNSVAMYTIGKAQELRDSIRCMGLTDTYKQWLYTEGHYTIQAEDIRRYCIDKALYTLGDNDEYTRLLMAIKGQRITLWDIARDIYDHSRYLDGMTVKDLEKEIITTIIKEI